MMKKRKNNRFVKAVNNIITTIALTIFITSVGLFDSENIVIPAIALLLSLGWLFMQGIKEGCNGSEI